MILREFQLVLVVFVISMVTRTLCQTVPCEDKLSNCAAYTEAACHLSAYPNFALDDCKKFCGNCCADAPYIRCSNSRVCVDPVAKELCPTTCGLCGTPSPAIVGK